MTIPVRPKKTGHKAKPHTAGRPRTPPSLLDHLANVAQSAKTEFQKIAKPMVDAYHTVQKTTHQALTESKKMVRHLVHELRKPQKLTVTSADSATAAAQGATAAWEKILIRGGYSAKDAARVAPLLAQTHPQLRAHSTLTIPSRFTLLTLVDRCEDAWRQAEALSTTLVQDVELTGHDPMIAEARALVTTAQRQPHRLLDGPQLLARMTWMSQCTEHWLQSREMLKDPAQPKLVHLTLGRLADDVLSEDFEGMQRHMNHAGVLSAQQQIERATAPASPPTRDASTAPAPVDRASAESRSVIAQHASRLAPIVEHTITHDHPVGNLLLALEYGAAVTQVFTQVDTITAPLGPHAADARTHLRREGVGTFITLTNSAVDHPSEARPDDVAGWKNGMTALQTLAQIFDWTMTAENGVTFRDTESDHTIRANALPREWRGARDGVLKALATMRADRANLINPPPHLATLGGRVQTLQRAYLYQWQREQSQQAVLSLLPAYARHFGVPLLMDDHPDAPATKYNQNLVAKTYRALAASDDPKERAWAAAMLAGWQELFPGTQPPHVDPANITHAPPPVPQGFSPAAAIALPGSNAATTAAWSAFDARVQSGTHAIAGLQLPELVKRMLPPPSPAAMAAEKAASDAEHNLYDLIQAAPGAVNVPSISTVKTLTPDAIAAWGKPHKDFAALAKKNNLSARFAWLDNEILKPRDIGDDPQHYGWYRFAAHILVGAPDASSDVVHKAVRQWQSEIRDAELTLNNPPSEAAYQHAVAVLQNAATLLWQISHYRYAPTVGLWNMDAGPSEMAAVKRGNAALAQTANLLAAPLTGGTPDGRRSSMWAEVAVAPTELAARVRNYQQQFTGTVQRAEVLERLNMHAQQFGQAEAVLADKGSVGDLVDGGSTELVYDLVKWRDLHPPITSTNIGHVADAVARAPIGSGGVANGKAMADYLDQSPTTDAFLKAVSTRENITMTKRFVAEVAIMVVTAGVATEVRLIAEEMMALNKLRYAVAMAEAAGDAANAAQLATRLGRLTMVANVVEAATFVGMPTGIHYLASGQQDLIRKDRSALYNTLNVGLEVVGMMCQFGILKGIMGAYKATRAEAAALRGLVKVAEPAVARTAGMMVKDAIQQTPAAVKALMLEVVSLHATDGVTASLKSIVLQDPDAFASWCSTQGQVDAWAKTFGMILGMRGPSKMMESFHKRTAAWRNERREVRDTVRRTRAEAAADLLDMNAKEIAATMRDLQKMPMQGARSNAEVDAILAKLEALTTEREGLLKKLQSLAKGVVRPDHFAVTKMLRGIVKEKRQRLTAAQAKVAAAEKPRAPTAPPTRTVVASSHSKPAPIVAKSGIDHFDVGGLAPAPAENTQPIALPRRPVARRIYCAAPRLEIGHGAVRFALAGQRRMIIGSGTRLDVSQSRGDVPAIVRMPGKGVAAFHAQIVFDGAHYTLTPDGVDANGGLNEVPAGFRLMVKRVEVNEGGERRWATYRLDTPGGELRHARGEHIVSELVLQPGDRIFVGTHEITFAPPVETPAAWSAIEREPMSLDACRLLLKGTEFEAAFEAAAKSRKFSPARDLVPLLEKTVATLDVTDTKRLSDVARLYQMIERGAREGWIDVELARRAHMALEAYGLEYDKSTAQLSVLSPPESKGEPPDQPAEPVPRIPGYSPERIAAEIARMKAQAEAMAAAELTWIDTILTPGLEHANTLDALHEMFDRAPQDSLTGPDGQRYSRAHLMQSVDALLAPGHVVGDIHQIPVWLRATVTRISEARQSADARADGDVLRLPQVPPEREGVVVGGPELLDHGDSTAIASITLPGFPQRTQWVIGRDPNSAVVLTDPKMSKTHAHLHYDPATGQCTLEVVGQNAQLTTVQRGDTTHTFTKGESFVVHSGDVITMGTQQFTWQSQPLRTLGAADYADQLADYHDDVDRIAWEGVHADEPRDIERAVEILQGDRGYLDEVTSKGNLRDRVEALMRRAVSLATDYDPTTMASHTNPMTQERVKRLEAQYRLALTVLNRHQGRHGAYLTPRIRAKYEKLLKTNFPEVWEQGRERARLKNDPAAGDSYFGAVEHLRNLFRTNPARIEEFFKNASEQERVDFLNLIFAARVHQASSAMHSIDAGICEMAPLVELAGKYGVKRETGIELYFESIGDGHLVGVGNSLGEPSSVAPEGERGTRYSLGHTHPPHFVDGEGHKPQTQRLDRVDLTRVERPSSMTPSHEGNAHGGGLGDLDIFAQDAEHVETSGAWKEFESCPYVCARSVDGKTRSYAFHVKNHQGRTRVIVEMDTATHTMRRMRVQIAVAAKEAKEWGSGRAKKLAPSVEGMLAWAKRKGVAVVIEDLTDTIGYERMRMDRILDVAETGTQLGTYAPKPNAPRNPVGRLWHRNGKASDDAPAPQSQHDEGVTARVETHDDRAENPVHDGTSSTTTTPTTAGKPTPSVTPPAVKVSRAVIDGQRAHGREVTTDAVVLHQPFDFREGTRQIPTTIGAAAYAPQERALLMTLQPQDGVLAIERMDADARTNFEIQANRCGYLTTNPRRDGSLRSDAATVEYHIIAQNVSPETVAYLMEHIPHVRVIRYDSAAAAAQGHGEVLYDNPRKFTIAELKRDGEVRMHGGRVEVWRDGHRCRDFPVTQVVKAFYAYEARLTPKQRDDVHAWLDANGKQLSQMTRDEGKMLLDHLQTLGWARADAQRFIGVEGMRLMYNQGVTLPFGFTSEAEYQKFSGDLAAAFRATGLPLPAGRDGVVLVGSGAHGYSSKGGEFRWEPRGKAKPSDYDVRLRLPKVIFQQWLDHAANTPRLDKTTQGEISALEAKKKKLLSKTQGPFVVKTIQEIDQQIAELRKRPPMLRPLSEVAQQTIRRMADEHGYIRWDKMPEEFQAHFAAIMQHYPRMQGFFIVEAGGAWDPQIDGARDSLYDTPLFPIQLGP